MKHSVKPIMTVKHTVKPICETFRETSDDLKVSRETSRETPNDKSSEAVAIRLQSKGLMLLTVEGLRMPQGRLMTIYPKPGKENSPKVGEADYQLLLSEVTQYTVGQDTRLNPTNPLHASP